MQWCHFWYHWNHVEPRTVPVVHLIFIILTNQMQWCHWWGSWQHMMLMLMPVVHYITKKFMLHLIFIWSLWPNKWNGTIDNTSYHVTLTEASKALHDLERYVTHHSDNIALTNALVLLMMSSVSCDAIVGITWPKRSCCILFQSSRSSRQSGAIDNSISVI